MASTTLRWITTTLALVLAAGLAAPALADGPQLTKTRAERYFERLVQREDPSAKNIKVHCMDITASRVHCWADYQGSGEASNCGFHSDVRGRRFLRTVDPFSANCGRTMGEKFGKYWQVIQDKWLIIAAGAVGLGVILFVITQAGLAAERRRGAQTVGGGSPASSTVGSFATAQTVGGGSPASSTVGSFATGMMGGPRLTGETGFSVGWVILGIVLLPLGLALLVCWILLWLFADLGGEAVARQQFRSDVERGVHDALHRHDSGF